VLWLKAQQEKRLLIKTDKEFSIHRDEAHHGILIVRLKQPTRPKIHQRVMQAITKYSEQQRSPAKPLFSDLRRAWFAMLPENRIFNVKISSQ
jgi:hypothetical protein